MKSGVAAQALTQSFQRWYIDKCMLPDGSGILFIMSKETAWPVFSHTLENLGTNRCSLTANRTGLQCAMTVNIHTKHASDHAITAS